MIDLDDDGNDDAPAAAATAAACQPGALRGLMLDPPISLDPRVGGCALVLACVVMLLWWGGVQQKSSSGLLQQSAAPKIGPAGGAQGPGSAAGARPCSACWPPGTASRCAGLPPDPHTTHHTHHTHHTPHTAQERARQLLAHRGGAAAPDPNRTRPPSPRGGAARAAAGQQQRQRQQEGTGPTLLNVTNKLGGISKAAYAGLRPLGQAPKPAAGGLPRNALALNSSTDGPAAGAGPAPGHWAPGARPSRSPSPLGSLRQAPRRWPLPSAILAGRGAAPSQLQQISASLDLGPSRAPAAAAAAGGGSRGGRAAGRGAAAAPRRSAFAAMFAGVVDKMEGQGQESRWVGRV
jgi:hypothetical protein